MAVRSLSLFFLQTVAAAPALVARQDFDLKGASCPNSDGSIIVRSGKSWTVGCGLDAYGNDIGAKQFSNFDKCIQACGMDKACVAVAYEGKNCYMKNKIGDKKSKATVWGAFLIPGSGPGSKVGTPTDQKPKSSAAASVVVASVAAPSAAIASAASSNVIPAASASPIPIIENVKAPAAASSVVASASGAKASSVATGSDGSCARPAGKSLSTKRGAAYNSVSMLTPLSGKISWAYNWASGPDGSLPSGVQYIPMLWGGDSARGNGFKAAAATAVAAGADTLLGFNEPDHNEQAKMDVNTAATAWKTYMEPLKCTARLGAPAVTNGGSPMGLTWLKGFLAACSGCTIDVVPIHWYDSASNVAYFKNYITEAYAAGGNRPLWLTEFGASGSDAAVATFLKTVIPWLDASPMVERYSYFMATTGSGMLMSSASSLSTIGQAYASA